MSEQKETPEDSPSGAKGKEEVFFRACPCCNAPLVVYIDRDTTAVVAAPKTEG